MSQRMNKARISDRLARALNAGTLRPARSAKAVDGQDGREAIFFALLATAHLPRPVAEYRFAPPRRWRMDYAWPELRVALEVEGGVWTHGRHTRGAGFLADLEKYNRAASLGWRVLRCTPDTLATLSTVHLIGVTLTIRPLVPAPE